MDGINRDNLYNDKGYRVRCMKSLLRQVTEDHDECNHLWKRLKRGATDIYEVEEFLRVFSWLKEGLNTLKELRIRGIEGISWGEIKNIEKDIEDKETQLRLLLVSSELKRQGPDTSTISLPDDLL